MKVLLAVDASKYSSVALRLVQTFRLPPGSELTVLHISDPIEGHIVLAESRSQEGKKRLATLRKNIDAKAQLLVNHLASPFRGKELDVHPVVKEGLPGAEILTAVEENQVDLVVVGTKGLSGMKRMWLGSVSEWVVSDAACSVLVVRSQLRRSSLKRSQGLHVLLATDGSSDSIKAVAFLKTLGLPKGSRVTLLHVVEKHRALIALAWATGHMDTTKFAKELRRSDQETGERLVENAKRNLESNELKVDTKILDGHIAEVILKAADKLQAGLVVIGSRGETGLRRVMLGSVSSKVVRHAPCSVLVVR